MSLLDERFELVKNIGHGTFGSVVLARVRSPEASGYEKHRQFVAIKTIVERKDEKGRGPSMREVQALKTIPPHRHIICVLETFMSRDGRTLHMVLEKMECNLLQLIQSRGKRMFDISTIKSVLYQLLDALKHVHKHGFFHRDVKPENILVSKCRRPESIHSMFFVKLADFGLSREKSGSPPFTSYVSTRWYRSPEVILRANQYGSPMDIWALGAVAFEIATLRPLFPGNTEIDQMQKICEIIGSPGMWITNAGRNIGGGDWRNGVAMAEQIGVHFPLLSPIWFDRYLSGSWATSFSCFLQQCLTWDPNKRATASTLCVNDFIADAYDPLSSRHNTRQRGMSDPSKSQKFETPRGAYLKLFRHSANGHASRSVREKQINSLAAMDTFRPLLPLIRPTSPFSLDHLHC